MSKIENLERFGLNDGIDGAAEFFGHYKYKNLWWELNGKKIGYGDLTETNLQVIYWALRPGEEFVGWNEHHGTEWQQTDTPMVRITIDGVKHREEIVATEGHRK